ncbi:MAG: DUF11 domain-containing protein, partial [Saprospiraceae bacterium]|nr:DUF11 domain-containing protein [Saprospiraceae bacterium]
TTYTVTQDDLNSGANLVNTVTITTDETPDPVTDDESTPVKQLPAIQLIKTGTYVDLAPAGFNAGDEIVYNFIIENTGNVTLTNVYISDFLVTLVGGPIPVLNPGDIDNSTISATYIIQQSDIDNGSFSNQAFVYGTPPMGSEVSDDDTDDQTFGQNPSISLIKKGTFVDLAPAGYNPGDQIDYKFYVTNSGNVTLYNIEVSDPLVSVNGGTLASLAPGETDSITFTASLMVDQMAIDTGKVTNVASVVGYAPDNSPVFATDNHIENMVQTPSFSIVKTQTGGPNPVTTAGQVIDYTIVVSNTGNLTLTNVVVNDVMPDGSTGALGLPTESVSTNGSLNVGETWTYTISYTVTQADIDAGLTLVNRVSATTDEDPTPETDEEPTPVSQTPSFTVTKTQTGGPSPVTSVGQVIDYTIVVTNTGNLSLTNVVVTDLMPDGTMESLGTPMESISVNDSLNVGETWTYTISYTVTQADIDAGLALVNTVSVTTEEDPNPETDDETTPVSQQPSFNVVKTQTGGPSPVSAAGQVLDYTIVVTNTGNLTLTNIMATDQMPDGSNETLGSPMESLSANGVLNIGETWTYFASYTVTQADIDAGLTLINRVSVTTDEDPTPQTDEAPTPVSQLPSFNVSKTQTGGPNPVTAAGQVIDYTIVVSNTGNLTLTNVVVNDVMPDGSTGALGLPVESVSTNGNLNVGETWTYTISYTTTQSDVDDGTTLVNRVSVTTDEDPTPETDEAPTPVNQSPSFSVVKTQTGGPNPVTTAGQVIDYTIVVTNTGNVTLTNIAVVDQMPDGDSGSLGAPIESVAYDAVLNVNETWTFNVSYTVTQADLDAGTNLVNTVTVTTEEDPTPETDDATTPVSQQPSFTVSKIQTGGPNPVSAAGQVIDYTILVSNTGNVTLTNVMVSDAMPDGSAGVLALPTESVSSNGNLNVGETWTYTISYTVTQADLDAGLTLVNTVTVTTEEDPMPHTDDAPTLVNQMPSFSVVKTQTGGPSPVTAAGQVIDYTIVVSNTGNLTLNNVVVNDMMPDGSPGLLGLPAESVSSNGNLNVGETWTYTISYTVSQSDIDAGLTLVNRVSVTTDEDPTPETDEEPTPVSQNPSFTVVKTQTGGPNPATVAGDVLSYTIVVSNTGNVTLTNVVVNDVMPDGSTGALGLPTENVSSNGNLNVGETWTYNISYTVTQSDIDAGTTLVNTVTVTTEEDPTPETDDAPTPVSQSPSFTVSKTQTGGPNPATTAGEVLDYTIVINNTGNVTLTNVVVNDVMPDGSIGALGLPTESVSSNGNLNVGETWTYTISYTVTQADIDAGLTLVNTVTVTTDEDPMPETDDAPTPVSQSPSFTVSKTQTGGPNPVTAAGEVLNYTIVVSNTGNVTLTNVVVNDVMPDGSIGALGLPTESVSSNGNLNVGETWTYTISYTVTQADIDAGLTLVNTVSVTTDEDPMPETDDAPTPVNQQPKLWMTKASILDLGVNNQSNPGDVITYTYQVVNSGNTTIQNLTINENLDNFTGNGGLPVPVFQSASMGSGEGTLLIGETATYVANYTITLADIVQGQIINQAIAAGSTPNGIPVSDLSDSANPSDPNETGSPGDPDGNDPTTTIIPPPPPVAVDDVSPNNTPGTTVSLNILGNDNVFNGDPATPANTQVVLIDPATGLPTVTPNTVTIAGQGVYTYNPATGVLSFDPNPGFTLDPTPIDYILTETATGLSDTANVLITYIELPPLAVDDSDLGNAVGTNGSVNILANDQLSDGSPATISNTTVVLIDPSTGLPTLTPNVVTIAGMGVYTYNPATGELVFDPAPGFTTDPTPINYILTETLTGLTDQATVTITYIEQPPVANDDQDLGNAVGTNVTLNLLLNDDVSDGSQATVSNTTVTLIDPTTGLATTTPNVVTIAGQGVYTYNPATGDLTFDPNPGFTTDPTPVNYVLTENLTGLTDVANVTITYIEQPPIANDDQSLNNAVGSNAAINLLTNDDLSDGTQATIANTTVTLIDPATGVATTTPNVVTIPGQGVYTYNPATGVLTFDPNPGFTTDPTPINYILKETLTGLTDPATVTITYLEQPPVANDDQSLNNVVGNNATLNLLTNDDLSDGSQATTTNTSVVLVNPATGLPTTTPNVVTIPGQGVYTYNPSTGVLTFDPNPGFTTDPTPITYILTETLTGLTDVALVTVTYTEIPPIANNDSSLENAVNSNVTINILSNDDISDGSQATTANTTVILINPATGLPTATPNVVTIPGQGVYTYNPATGNLTFDPNPGFGDDPTPLTYTLTENQTGLSDQAVVTITYVDIVESIGSLVWEDVNGDGIYQTNEPGVPNVQVELFDPSGNLIATTFTDNTGRFVFTGILAGTYYFRFTPDPSYGFTFANVGSNNNVDSDVDGGNGAGTTGLVTFTSGQTDLTWYAGLYKCVQIGERVWYDVDKDDVQDQTENGINGLKVNLWRVVGSTKSIYESKYTGHKPGTGSTDGYFQFCAPPGTYYIEVIMPPIGLVQARANIGNDDNLDSDLTNANGKATSSNFTVLSGQAKNDLGAGFYPMATAGNLVWIDDNNDGVQQSEEPRVANVLVEAFDTLNQKVAEDYTDQNGVYKIEYLGKSSYYLRFNPPSGYGYTMSVTQDDAMNSDVDHSNGLNTTRRFDMAPGVNYVNIDAGLAFGALPVRWLDVNAENKGSHNLITWSTASEVNSDKFIVQRRHESEVDFTDIAEVKAAGISSDVRKYQTTDGDIAKGGVYYYRIQQWDKDGRNALSRTVAVRIEVKDNKVALYPNPARDYSTLSVELKGNEDAVVYVFNVEGQLVQTYNLESENKYGLNKKIRISGLSTGVYMVQTTQGSYTDIKKLIITE